jgi:hypothetical protein
MVSDLFFLRIKRDSEGVDRGVPLFASIQSVCVMTNPCSSAICNTSLVGPKV